MNNSHTVVQEQRRLYSSFPFRVNTIICTFGAFQAPSQFVAKSCIPTVNSKTSNQTSAFSNGCIAVFNCYNLFFSMAFRGNLSYVIHESNKWNTLETQRMTFYYVNKSRTINGCHIISHRKNSKQYHNSRNSLHISTFFRIG